MNTNHIYYKELECPHYTSLQQQALEWLLARDLVHNKDTATSRFAAVDEVSREVPMIANFLNLYGLEAKFITVHRSIRTFDFRAEEPLTVDWGPDTTAIEIPIIGQQHSERVFYQARVTGLKKNVHGVPYWECDSSTAREVARTQPLMPIVMRADVPSRVELHRQFLTRISLVIKTTPDPYRLKDL